LRSGGTSARIADMETRQVLKNVAKGFGLTIASLFVLLGVFIIFLPAEINYESEAFKIAVDSTNISVKLFSKEAQIIYNFDGRYTDYKTIYYETTIKDPTLITHDADVIRARLGFLGINLYELTALPEEGRIKLTVPSWVDEATLDQYLTGKGQLTFTVYTQAESTAISDLTGDGTSDPTVTDSEIPQQTQPLISSIQFLDGDIASASYSELQDMPTVEISFNSSTELSTRIPADVFRRSQGKSVYLYLDLNTLGESTQTIYQLNGEAPAVAAYKSPWELKSLTLAINPANLFSGIDPAAAEAPEITPEVVYRLLNFGQLKTDWTLSETQSFPSVNWQPITLLLVPLTAITGISIYLLASRKRIEWLIFAAEGLAISLFLNALAIRLFGIAISPFCIIAYALTTIVFAWTIGHAANQSKTKLESGASIYAGMKAAIVEARGDVLATLALITASGLFLGIAPLTIMSITAITYILALYIIENSISNRLIHEKDSE